MELLPFFVGLSCSHVTGQKLLLRTNCIIEEKNTQTQIEHAPPHIKAVDKTWVWLFCKGDLSDKPHPRKRKSGLQNGYNDDGCQMKICSKFLYRINFLHVLKAMLHININLFCIVRFICMSFIANKSCMAFMDFPRNELSFSVSNKTVSNLTLSLTYIIILQMNGLAHRQTSP